MRQYRITGAYQFNVEDVPIPEIKETEALLKIFTIGVCASDMQIYHGKHKFMSFPVILGHEAAAVIEKCGAAVKGFAQGERVTVEPQVTCGSCFPCRIGRFNVCEKLSVLGVHKDGFSCEYAAVDAKYLHKCPKNMSFEHIALVEPFAVGAGAVNRAERIKDARVVVVGAGTIGNFTAQAAKSLGAKEVLITDISEDKLKIARECGIDFCINTKDISLKDAVIKKFGADRADIIIDCAATKGSFLSILEAARQRSEIIITGNYKEPVEFNVPLLQRQEITMKGHMMYVREDFETAIDLLSRGKIVTEKIITKVFSFADYEAAFKYADEHAGEVMKVLINRE